MRKDTRLQLVVPAQLKNDLQTLARFADCSVNEFICCNLTAIVARRFAEIEAMTRFDEKTRFETIKQNFYKKE